MHSPIEPVPANLAKRRLSSVLLSIALHMSILALALQLGRLARTRIVEQPATRPPMALLETAGASHAIRIELPAADFAAHTRTPTPDPEATKKTILPIEQKPKMSGGGAPKTPHAGDGSGQALSGNGSDAEDARPAFPTHSPRPPVTDRSLLPPSEVKVVVDVDVDAFGQVVHETLVKGIGNKLDQIVLDTVMTWRFQPATLNGKPVASEAELIFPFNPSYPITVS